MHIGIVKQEKGVLQLSHFNFFLFSKHLKRRGRDVSGWGWEGGGGGVSIPQVEQVPLKVGSLVVDRKEIETYK